jgi:MFS transporter, SHS family, lactate transporter
VIVLTFLGPEYLRRQFGVDHDLDMDEVAGHDTIEAAIHRREATGMRTSESDPDDINHVEKGTARA